MHFTYYYYHFYRVVVESRTRVCHRIRTNVRVWIAAAAAKEIYGWVSGNGGGET